MQQGSNGIAYKVIKHHKYKYQLTQDHEHYLDPSFPAVWVGLKGGWIEIRGRTLLIKRGYCWDGASGPALTTPDFMEPSLVHDAIYQLIAAGLLKKKPWKKYADMELYRVAALNYMPRWRRTYAYYFVRVFGQGRDRYNHPSGV